MKRHAVVAILTVAAVCLLLAPVTAQGPGPGQGQSTLINYVNSLPLQQVDSSEEAALRVMIQDEKLARDFYLAMDYFWGQPIFANIAKSEQQHMDWLKLIYTRNKLTYPITDDRVGQFPDPAFQQLWTLMVIIGSQSNTNALWLGNAVEDLDIYDLMKLLPQTDNRDIQTVYQNLLKGSRNHLRAFNSVLTSFNGSYSAIFISPTLFTAIVTSAHETAVAYDENGKPLP